MTRNVWMYLALVFLVLFSSLTFAENNSWLTGTWVLTYDPDGATRDEITFSNDGVFTTTEISSGRQIKGVYFVKPRIVKVSLMHEGMIFMKLDLTFDEKKNRLYYKGSSGNPSYYTKLKR